MFRVVIADDHRLLLEGLVSALEALPDVTVVATAGGLQRQRIEFNPE